MTSFIDEHRGDYGVEPICRVLPIAPSTYHERVAQRRDPSRLSPRAQRDEAMKPEVERLMRELGLQGVIRGKPVKTTVSDKVAPCPLDQVNRQFHAPAPNMLWVSDFTYLATWSGCASSTSWAMSVISQSRHTSGHRRGNAKHLTDTDEVIIHHVQRDGIGVVLDLL
jgi:transposase InsO family protein